MKFERKVSDKTTVTIEAETMRDAVKRMSDIEEVFGEDTCGKCKGHNLKFVVRKVEDNEYYELRCSDCGAKLAFGCNKKGGGLFPKRKDAEGNWLNDSGWVKWNPDTQKEE